MLMNQWDPESRQGKVKVRKKWIYLDVVKRGTEDNFKGLALAVNGMTDNTQKLTYASLRKKLRQFVHKMHLMKTIRWKIQDEELTNLTKMAQRKTHYILSQNCQELLFKWGLVSLLSKTKKKVSKYSVSVIVQKDSF